MNFEKKRIGVWGLGIVGKSAVSFFSQHTCNIEVMDTRTLSDDESTFLTMHNARFAEQRDLISFFDRNDYIFASSGIDISSYLDKYRSKWIFEVDLFYTLFKKPIIAITGSVGKTTITSFIASLLTMYGKKVALGGNIGHGLFDLIEQQNEVDYAVIELSSFQLEHCKIFAPDFAIWTNLIENHLDRHKTMHNYFLAKYAIMAHQKSHQKAIIPLALSLQVRHLCSKHPLIFFHEKKDEIIAPNDALFYLDNNTIRLKTHTNDTLILNDIPDISYKTNWLAICALLHSLNLDLSLLNAYAKNLTLAEHRTQKIGTINDVTFYNDSKATTPVSTLAALEHFAHKRIHLFLGGLSKGVDRSPFVASLKKFNIHLYCFGAEAVSLHTCAEQHHIPSLAFSSLKAAFDACISNVNPHDIVLFSPSGSSYDLFKDYAERGTYFTKLVMQHSNSIAQSNTMQ